MDQSTLHTYSFPTEIRFGTGSRKTLAQSFLDRDLKKPLVVTDEGLADLPVCQNFVKLLTEQGLSPSVFSKIKGNPVVSHVHLGVQAYRDSHCDSIIAFGGGAAMDIAKIIAIMIYHPGEVFDYEDGKPDGLPVDQTIPFLVALPTTAGTGSEVGRSGVVSDDQTHVKKIIFSPRILPQIVFADPELTLELPASVTAATGIDALTHLIEAYLAKGYHPICDGIALEGIKLVHRSLLKCVEFVNKKEGATPEHLQARGEMLNAAMMGAIAFQKGLGVNHSMAHALSTVCDLHHGLANALVLPHVMKFNHETNSHLFQQMAQAIGISSKNGNEFVEWIKQLTQELNIPGSLKEVGVDENQLKDLIEIAYQDPCHAFNPRDVQKSDLEQLFQQAYQG